MAADVRVRLGAAVHAGGLHLQLGRPSGKAAPRAGVLHPPPWRCRIAQMMQGPRSCINNGPSSVFNCEWLAGALFPAELGVLATEYQMPCSTGV